MGQPQARVSDLTSGHGPFQPQPIDTGNDTVLVNGMPISFQGQMQAQPHPQPPPITEPPFVMGEGSQTVLIQGKGQNRLGDMTVCGQFIAQGSANVLIG